mmetsp:Transcript_24352/g.33220  ORF Transcript_24352/g.33220 Transcript_24352/m.33220 type:complete len:246 (+) Transcript_24352:47-784(+)|eukprot:CAMPEP_0176369506 /NCGR_PEP_ID=MMETSP0126-20121128/23335_1 /TAXON_ID=141414 ORGANISM="Strombidinopsis acuminatum, Strain SPMC142" /NCGR_SAMPLE_ID=MMETSP0126 /ASSEMBLY_ACC=CAM_ASM_000229 /LENGTH=245 /DNA_ID=CAMNT_0017728169 /DNA_START=43 /DNA_END=780 /DNA_ORIENTATION=-
MTITTTTIARLALLLGFALGQDEPSWNYDNAGTDWGPDYHGCDATVPGYIESPADLAYSNMTPNSDWIKYKFAFLPYFKAGQASSYGPEDWVYKIHGDDFGLLTAAEPYFYSLGDYKITWIPTEIRFHYPAEHTVNGTAYDLEMQIIFNTNSKVLLCQAYQGALSVFFNIDDTAGDNAFFDWQSDATAGNDITVDLSMVVSRIAAMQEYIYGYIGSDSQPPCTQKLCWYFLMNPLTMSTSQFNFF